MYIVIKGKRKGFIRVEVKTRDVAQFAVMCHEGFYGMIKGLGANKTFDVLKESLSQYFESIRP